MSEHEPSILRELVLQRFVEYRDVSGAEPLRQGDILESVDPSASKWQRHLFVMTADCDFAFDKHMGRVTCVPVLTADEYLIEMQVPRQRDKLVQPLLTDLQSVLRATGAPNVTPGRLREWISEEDPRDVLASVKVSGSDDLRAERAINAIRLIDTPASTVTDVTRMFVEALLMGNSSLTPEKARNRVMDPLRGVFKQPPGDALFLSSLAPDHGLGYFAYLRHLEQVWQPEIAIGPTNTAVKYRRISRLQDRYTHALVQRFGMVFMAIGLPTEYEEMRSTHAELLGEADQ